MSEKLFDALRERVQNEPYAKMLGLDLVKVERGYALIRMAFSERHHNIYGRCHGGAIFSLIDEAFQIAANSSGVIEIALNVNVSYMKSPREGEVLHAEAKRIETSRRIGHYDIEVRNASGEIMAACRATSYRRDDPPPFL